MQWTEEAKIDTSSMPNLSRILLQQKMPYHKNCSGPEDQLTLKGPHESLTNESLQKTYVNAIYNRFFHILDGFKS